MAQKKDFQRVSEYIWELPQDFRDDMRVPARLLGDKELFEAAFRDRTVRQLTNVATLPGIVKHAMAMPDFHQGYGFPIGGVAAIRRDTGVISPGGVGYDINCGVRLLGTHLEHEQIAPYLQDLTASLYRACPSGVGGKGRKQVSERELEELAAPRSARWARGTTFWRLTGSRKSTSRRQRTPLACGKARWWYRFTADRGALGTRCAAIT